jgi:hypothetical protein
VDVVEPQVRALLAEFPRMPATVIGERIGWTHSLTVLKDRVRELRPLFLPPDPTDRVEYVPGELAQCDLWFPPVPIPVGASGARVMPVLAMTCGYSRVTDAVMIPSRKAGDILAGMWEIIGGWGRCPRTLVWDREAAIGGAGKPSVEAAAFAGTLGVRIKLTPARDPESKGLVAPSGAGAVGVIRAGPRNLGQPYFPVTGRRRCASVQLCTPTGRAAVA